MMPPTSIDGTDITGATIDGTDVQEITVDGQTVFGADKNVDGFETGNINNYTVLDAGFSVTSSNVFEGTNALTSNSDATITTTNPPGGNVPSFGTDFEAYFRVDGATNVGLSYESSGQISQVQVLDGFSIRLRPDKNQFSVFKGTPGDLDANFKQNNSVSYTSGIYYRVKVTFSGNTATVELFDTTTNSLESTITHDSSGSQGSHYGLFSFIEGGGGSVFVDSIRTL